MNAISHILEFCLVLSVAYTLAGLALKNKLHLKFGLIFSFTFAGLLGMWPPSQKLKLGIDLSGGTILVYQVDKANLPSNFNMDELIAALKQRADPQGVKEMPIRKIGGNRIEIILPEATPEEVEEGRRDRRDSDADRDLWRAFRAIPF